MADSLIDVEGTANDLGRLLGPLAHRARGVLRIGIDGPSASGKTTLAGLLCPILEASGVQVLHLQLDDFHPAPERRHRRGTERAARQSKS